MIKTSYDPIADAFSAWFAPDTMIADHTDEVAPGVMIDYDALGNAIGVEVLGVRSRLEGKFPATGEKPRAA